jgi:hypothetical protein
MKKPRPFQKKLQDIYEETWATFFKPQDTYEKAWATIVPKNLCNL